MDEHTTIVLLELKFRFWAWKFTFLSSSDFFLSWNSRSMDKSQEHTKFGVEIPCLGSQNIISTFFISKSIFILDPNNIFNWWMYLMLHDHIDFRAQI
jgi:hypothetical protein